MSGLSLLSTNKNSAAFKPGYAPSDLGDVTGAAFESVRQNYTTDAELRLVGDPINKRNKLIQERFGKPVSDLTGTSAKYTNPSMAGRVAQAKEDNDLIDQIIARGRKESPGQWDGIQTTAELRDAGKAVAQEAMTNADEVTQRNPNAASRLTGQFVGGVAGAFTDPTNLATLPIGAGETKMVGSGAMAFARALTVSAVKEGALQSAIQAASIPQIARWQNEVGHKYGMSEATADIAMGFAGGAVMRGGTEAFIPAMRGIGKGAQQVSSVVLDNIATRAPKMTQTLRDGLRYMSRNAFIDEAAPTPLKNMGDVKAHRDVVEKVFQDVNQYKRPAAEVKGVTKIITPRNELELQVQSRVVDLADLVTSDQAKFDQSLQPRQRSARMASDVRINEIAANLDPAQLGDSRVSNTGSPIVGPDMMVESGNGRVMALSKAYEAHPERAQEYRDFLESQGYDTAGMERPVLIRQRLSELDDAQRRNFVVYSNEDVADRLSTTERAMADARLISPAVLDAYKGGDVENAMNADFVRGFVDTAVSPAERNSFITPGGKVSQEGVKRVRGALLARAYSDADLVQKLLEDTDTNIKTIGGVMMDLSGDWARLRAEIQDGNVPPMFDITADLMDAVKTIINARDQGRPIGEFINQRGLFAETDLTAETSAILRGMYNDKLTRPLGFDKVKEFLGAYLKGAAKQKAGPDLLGLKPIEPMDLLTMGLEKLHGKDATQEMNFDLGGSREMAAVRDAGLQDLVKGVAHPTKNISFFKALEDMAARPETMKGVKAPERAALHTKIIDDLTAEQRKKAGGAFAQDRVIELVLGPPGAGKSTVLVKRLQKDLRAVIIDSDMIKEKMPEFDDGLGANAVHEESKMITKEWMAQRIADGDNIIYPIVGADADKVATQLDVFQELGYAVNIRLVHIPADESLRRVITRFGEEGRLVPPSYVMSIGDGPIKTFDRLKQREDINVYSYFDNNVKIGQEPRIVESNDPQYVASQAARSRIEGSGEAGARDPGGEVDAEIANAFFDDNAFRLREYRDDPIVPPSEINPTDRLAARQAEFDVLVKENPDLIVTAEDGSSITMKDYAARMKEDAKIIEALTTCRIA